MAYVKSVAVWLIILTALAHLAAPLCVKNGWITTSHHNPNAGKNTALTACVPGLRVMVAAALLVGMTMHNPKAKK